MPKKTKKLVVKKEPKMTKEQKKHAAEVMRFDQQLSASMQQNESLVRSLATANQKLKEAQASHEAQQRRADRLDKKLDQIRMQAQIAVHELDEVPDECTSTQKMQRAMGTATGHLRSILEVTTSQTPFSDIIGRMFS